VHACREKRATRDARKIYRADGMFTVGSELPTSVTEMSTPNKIATDWSGVVRRTTERLAGAVPRSPQRPPGRLQTAHGSHQTSHARLRTSHEQLRTRHEQSQMLNEQSQASHEQLQRSPEQLQLSSEQLHRSPEQLQASPEQLRTSPFAVASRFFYLPGPPSGGRRGV
jgi:hypothetical protein